MQAPPINSSVAAAGAPSVVNPLPQGPMVVTTHINKNLQLLALVITIGIGVAMTIHIFHETKLFRLQYLKLQKELSESKKTDKPLI